MRKNEFFAVLIGFGFLLLSFHSKAQEMRAYQLFDKTGQPATFAKMLEKSEQTDVVLFGELHNNPISHWLQLELSMALYQQIGENLVMGAEMFEADNQLIIEEYFSGLVSERNFRAEARFWSNYNTDIKPLLEFARENNLRFIATNVPRRYAALVHSSGLEALAELDPQALKYIAPLPIAYDEELPGYKEMLEMSAMHGQINPNFPMAQAIKDATMAHFILENLEAGKTFIHFHGTFHSNNYEGIVWYLAQSSRNPNIVTIATLEQEQVEVLEEKHLNIADFIIAVPSRMTKTH